MPTPQSPTLRTALEAARDKVEVAWIGLEAAMILRADKGYIVIGKDPDGSTMPQDLGWDGPRRRSRAMGRDRLCDLHDHMVNPPSVSGAHQSDACTAILWGTWITLSE